MGIDESATSDALRADQPRKEITTSLTKEIVREARIANDQRITLFWIIISIVAVSIIAVGLFVWFLGSSVVELAVPVAVAFISAMAVQSFVLIGLLVRGLFMKPRHASQSVPVE